MKTKAKKRRNTPVIPSNLEDVTSMKQEQHASKKEHLEKKRNKVAWGH